MVGGGDHRGRCRRRRRARRGVGGRGAGRGRRCTGRRSLARRAAAAASSDQRGDSRQRSYRTELTIDDGSKPPKDRVDYDRWGDRLLLLAEDKVGYMNLCRLISMAQMPNAKGMARLAADNLAGLSNHLIALVADPKERLPFYQEVFGRDRVFIELHDHFAPDDRSRNQRGA